MRKCGRACAALEETVNYRWAFVCAATGLAALMIVGCGNHNAANKSPADRQPRAAAPGSTTKSSDRPPAKVPPELEAFLKSAAAKPVGKDGAAGAVGQSPDKSAASAGVPQPGARPTAKQLLSAVQMLYGGMESARCEGISSTVVKHDGKIAAQIKNTPFTILFKRPDKVKMTGPESEMVSDGKTVYTYLPQAKRYTREPAGDDLLQALVMSKAGVGIMGLLLRVDYENAIAGSKLLPDSKIRGNEVYVLYLDLKAPHGARASQKLWIGKKDLIIYRNEVVTRGKPQRPEGYAGKLPDLVQTTTIGTLKSFEPNPRLADSQFRFKPPAGARLAEAPKPVDLMNKPAPDFAFKWTDGEEKKLSDFRGRPVLLNFWALPDCEAQLPVLQSVHRDLNGVQLITVNLNSEAEEVDEVLQQKNYDFPVIHGTESIGKTAFERYGLVAIPTMFIIDAEGIVRGGMVGIATLDEIRAKLKKSGIAI